MVSAGGNERLERLPAHGGREVRRVLRLAGRNLGEARLERVRLHLADRAEVAAEDDGLERHRGLARSMPAVERAGRIAEVDVARHGRRVARAAEDPGDRLVVLLLVQIGLLQVLGEVAGRVRCRNRLGVEVGCEQLCRPREASCRPGRIREAGLRLPSRPACRARRPRRGAPLRLVPRGREGLLC